MAAKFKKTAKKSSAGKASAHVNTSLGATTVAVSVPTEMIL